MQLAIANHCMTVREFLLVYGKITFKVIVYSLLILHEYEQHCMQ